jgi:hypothetical protein
MMLIMLLIMPMPVLIVPRRAYLRHCHRHHRHCHHTRSGDDEPHVAQVLRCDLFELGAMICFRIFSYIFSYIMFFYQAKITVARWRSRTIEIIIRARILNVYERVASLRLANGAI